jgi:DNA-binding IclR family transcriptional regulator
MTKHEACLDLLRSGEADGLSNPEIASRIGCNEGTVRRARAILEAEQLTDRSSDSDDPAETEADRLLREIIEADRAEELAAKALADAKEEVKQLKEHWQEFVDRRVAAGRAARETFPLFDRPVPDRTPTEDSDYSVEVGLANFGRESGIPDEETAGVA